MRSPRTCLRCGGHKWKIQGPALFFKVECENCGGSGCGVNEDLPPAFLILPPGRLITGQHISGEIECKTATPIDQRTVTARFPRR
jgi:hypothetical protein